MLLDNQNIRNAIRTLRALSSDDVRAYAMDTADDVLGRYGYQRRPSILGRILPMAGAFSAGIAIGTGVGMLLAPKSGPELRTELGGQIGELTGKVRAAVGLNGAEVSTETATQNGKGNGTAHA